MKPEELVMMANRIGAFFASQKGDEAAHGIVGHNEKSCSSGRRGEGLDPKVRNAVELLSHEQSGTPKG
jgi:hypothetical protein